MNLNRVILIGRLTRDPEVRSTPSGQSVASFGLATNRVWTNQEGQRQETVEYHNIVAWGKLADICSQYLAKGRLVMIEGRLQTRSWEGQDGVKRYRTEIVAENMQMGPRVGETGISSRPTPSTQEEVPTIQVDETPSSAKETSIPETENTEKKELSREEIPF